MHDINALPARKSLVDVRGPKWSPDGTRLLFWVDHRCEEFARDLYTIGADGKNRRRLIDLQRLGDAEWSPDGSQIAYVDCDNNLECDLLVMDSDGTQLTPLSEEGVIDSDSDISWSPSGDEVLVSYSNALWAESVDGSGGRVVAKWKEAQETATILDTSADGQTVALGLRYGYDGDVLKIMILRIDGTAARTFSPPAAPRGTERGYYDVFLP